MSKAAELAALIANVNKGSSLGNKNFIINGAMNVSQRSTSETGLGASAGYFTVDRWDMYFTGTAGRLTQAQIADGPSGFANCMKLSCTTADTSIAAGENVILQQHIEGQNLQILKKGTSSAVPITVSFWVKGNASATYTCGLWDNDNSRQNNQTFAVTTSWNRIELTFAGDTSGALDDDTANSLGFYIYLQAGSTYTGGTFTSGTWASVTNANTVKSDQTQFFDSTDRTFFITGVQMEIGEKATEFEVESYETTLEKCRRYYQLYHNDSGSADYLQCVQAYNATTTFGEIKSFFRPMRTTPTVGSSGTFNQHQNNSTASGSATPTLQSGSSNGWVANGWGGITSLTAGNAVATSATNGAKLTADAEL